MTTAAATAVPTLVPTKLTEHGCGAACAMCDKPLALLPPGASADPADDFVDTVTGHRIVRLSRLENGGSNFYFHQNEFNCRGNKLVFANAHGDLGRWLYSLDLETMEIQPLAESSAPVMEVVAPRRNEVLYLASDGTLRATNLDTHATRVVAQLPAGANGFTVNADETIVAGYYNEGLADYQAKYADSFNAWFTAYYRAHRLSYIYTVDIESGTVRRIHEEHNWLDHTQFSPVDPSLLMFSHEGPPDWVTDRMWVLDARAASAPRSLYTESVTNEYVNHQFFSPDGTKVYFDHQVPVFGAYSIGRVDLATGAVADFPIAAEDWGVHYNVSNAGANFASDGDDRGRKLAMLFHLVDGRLQSEPLADLSGSDYLFQPLVQFTRDDKWVIYQASKSNLVQVYAVEVAKH